MLKKSYVSVTQQSASLPSSMIDGAKTNISNVAAALSATSVPLTKGITIKCRSIGTGTYVAVGTLTTQSTRMVAGDVAMIDYIDNINKIGVVTDAGNTGALEYMGA